MAYKTRSPDLFQQSLRVICITASISIQASLAQDQEWPSYGGDLANTRYSPLDIVNRDNFNDLELAWEFDTSNFGPEPEYRFQSTPLMVAAGVGVKSPGEDAGTPSEVYEAVKVALALGGNVNAVNDRGETALHGAAYKYADAVVPLLIENGAKIEIWNQKNRQGWTPLRIAAGIHRTMNLRKSPEVAAELRKAMMAAGVSTHIDPETNISGGTR